MYIIYIYIYEPVMDTYFIHCLVLFCMYLYLYIYIYMYEPVMDTYTQVHMHVLAGTFVHQRMHAYMLHGCTCVPSPAFSVSVCVSVSSVFVPVCLAVSLSVCLFVCL